MSGALVDKLRARLFSANVRLLAGLRGEGRERSHTPVGADGSEWTAGSRAHNCAMQTKKGARSLARPLLSLASLMKSTSVPKVA